MEKARFRFKGYEFDYNPKSFSLRQERHMVEFHSPVSGSILQDLGFAAAIVTGEGDFYGKDAEAQYQTLCGLFELSGSGLLQLPAHKPFYAYFTALSATKKAGPPLIHYSFQFMEDSDKKRKEHPLYCFS